MAKDTPKVYPDGDGVQEPVVEEKVQDAPIAQTEPVKEQSKQYRYYCTACSGNAFMSDNNDPFDAVVCKSCGKEVKYDSNNYIQI